jgi:hypothetical protein
VNEIRHVFEGLPGDESKTWQALDDVLQRNARFEPRERRADAEVDPVAEPEVSL